jgi:hypothetical protein
MSEAGFGRMVAQVLSYPAGLQHVLAKIRSSGDAIDWVIQRTGDVKLPQQSSDIGAIHAFFSRGADWVVYGAGGMFQRAFATGGL